MNDAAQSVRVERKGKLAIVHLDSAHRLNLLDGEILEVLRQTADTLRAATDISAVVLTGKPTVFSAGMNLRSMEHLRAASLLERRHWLEGGPAVCAAWERIEAPTIAAIEGYCLGGALALAVSCDWRVASRVARFSLPEVPLGMSMSWQANPRLVALLGPARAKRLILLGEEWRAPQAERWGLVEAICPQGKALEHALALARKVGAYAPLGVRIAKRAINAASFALADAVSYADRDSYFLTMGDDMQRENLRKFRKGGNNDATKK